MSHHPVIVMDELSQSCSIRNNSLFTKTTKTESKKQDGATHVRIEREREREKLEGKTWP